MDDFNALLTVLDTPPLRPTAARPPEIAEFIRQFLTDGEVVELEQQFASSCEPNKQVMWTGIQCAAAQKWADHWEMQTLSTAMGPLRTRDASRKHLGKNRLTRYMRGASAEFAWYIARTSHVVTVLCPPPPQRFNPNGGTNMQLVELPILTGKIGGHAVARINAIHPTVREAVEFRYQFWPDDECDIWRKNYSRNVDGVTQWLRRSRKADVIRIEEKLRLTLNGTDDMVVYEAIFPRDTAASAAATWGETRMATNTASTINRSKTEEKKKETKEKQQVKTAPTASMGLEDGAKSKMKSQTTTMTTASTTNAKKKTKKETEKNTKTIEKNVTKMTKVEPQNKPKTKPKAKTKEKAKEKAEGETNGKIEETDKNTKEKPKETAKKKSKENPKGKQPMQAAPKPCRGHKNGSKSKRKAGITRMDKAMCLARMSSPARVDDSGLDGNKSTAGGRGVWIVVFVSVVEAGCFWFFGRSL